MRLREAYDSIRFKMCDAYKAGKKELTVGYKELESLQGAALSYMCLCDVIKRKNSSVSRPRFFLHRFFFHCKKLLGVIK
jgi:hypothetical protein